MVIAAELDTPEQETALTTVRLAMPVAATHSQATPVDSTAVT